MLGDMYTGNHDLFLMHVDYIRHVICPGLFKALMQTLKPYVDLGNKEKLRN